MRAFRFRAQAALDLRRREHDRALAHLAHTEEALREAAGRVAQADDAIRDADVRLRRSEGAPTARGELDWYRSWRVKCRLERDERERQRTTRELDVREAAQQAAATHRRVRSLEKLHDRALAEWRQAAEREEMKLIDALATAQFARRKDAV